MPIFPGETTLNAAATLAAQGKLDLCPIIVMGALGAILGDSALFWIARKFSARIERQLTRAKANKQVKQAFDLLDRSPAVLIIGGRYLPGMRFVVNATMGLSDIAYRRFLAWSVVSGILWSTYTSVLAYEIGLALGDYPLASFVISGLVTTVALAVVVFTVRRNRRRLAARERRNPGVLRSGRRMSETTFAVITLLVLGWAVVSSLLVRVNITGAARLHRRRLPAGEPGLGARSRSTSTRRRSTCWRRRRWRSCCSPTRPGSTS